MLLWSFHHRTVFHFVKDSLKKLVSKKDTGNFGLHSYENIAWSNFTLQFWVTQPTVFTDWTHVLMYVTESSMFSLQWCLEASSIASSPCPLRFIQIPGIFWGYYEQWMIFFKVIAIYGTLFWNWWSISRGRWCGADVPLDSCFLKHVVLPDPGKHLGNWIHSDLL